MQKRTLSLGPNRRLVAITGLVVVGLHLALLLFWLFGGRMEEVPKRPDIDIDLTAPAPVPADTQAPPTPVAPVAAPAPTERPPAKAPAAPQAPPSQPTDTTPVAPIEPTPTPPPAAPAPAPTGGASDVLPSALTADADYKAAELNNPKPLYPLTAVRQGAQGRVLLLVEVLADGRAGRVTLEKTSGHAILDASAMNTVRLWQFMPAKKDGVFVTQTIRVPIDFNLKDNR